MATQSEINDCIHGYLGEMGVLTVSNAFILGSPWEADFIKLRKSLYWAEYELKMTRADFRKDFKKSVRVFTGMADDPDTGRPRPQYKEFKKHEFYGSNEQASQYYNDRPIPKPRRFWFITPEGLISKEDLPEHGGTHRVQTDQICAQWRRVSALRH